MGASSRSYKLFRITNHRFWAALGLIIMLSIIVMFSIAFQQGWFSRIEGLGPSPSIALSEFQTDNPVVAKQIDDYIKTMKPRYSYGQRYRDIVTTLERIKSGSTSSGYTELVNLQTSAAKNNDGYIKNWANNNLKKTIAAIVRPAPAPASRPPAPASVLPYGFAPAPASKPPAPAPASSSYGSYTLAPAPASSPIILSNNVSYHLLTVAVNVFKLPRSDAITSLYFTTGSLNNVIIDPAVFIKFGNKLEVIRNSAYTDMNTINTADTGDAYNKLNMVYNELLQAQWTRVANELIKPLLNIAITTPPNSISYVRPSQIQPGNTEVILSNKVGVSLDGMFSPLYAQRSKIEDHGVGNRYLYEDIINEVTVIYNDNLQSSPNAYQRLIALYNALLRVDNDPFIVFYAKVTLGTIIYNVNFTGSGM